MEVPLLDKAERASLRRGTNAFEEAFGMFPTDLIVESGTPGDAVDEMIGWLDVEPGDDIDSVIYDAEPLASPDLPLQSLRKTWLEEKPTVTLDRDRFVDPRYRITEAADIVKVPTTTLAMWARGYVRRPPGRPEVWGDPIITSVGESGRNRPVIPFVGLAEATVLASIRSTGVPMKQIRPPLDHLQRELGLRHALAHRKLYTHGADLLYDFSKRHPDKDAAQAAGRLVVAHSRQSVFTEVIQESLQGFRYSEDGYVDLLRVLAYRQAEVVVDPTRSSGAPIFARGACRVEDVLHRFWAGESLRELTEEFRVPRDHLEDAIRVASRRAV